MRQDRAAPRLKPQDDDDDEDRERGLVLFKKKEHLNVIVCICIYFAFIVFMYTCIGVSLRMYLVFFCFFEMCKGLVKEFLIS